VSQGDLVIIITYQDLPEAKARHHRPALVYVDSHNRIVRTANEAAA